MLKFFLNCCLICFAINIYAEEEALQYIDDYKKSKNNIRITIKDPVKGNNITNVNILLKKADFFMINKHYFLAIQLINDAQKINITAVEYKKQIIQKIQSNAVKIYYMLNMLHSSKTNIYKLLNNNYNIFLNLLSEINFKENTQDSFVELENNISKYPYSQYLYEGLGKLYIKNNNLSLALQSYIHAYTIDRKNIMYLYNIGVIMEKLKKYKSALIIYQKIINHVNNQGMVGVVYPEIDVFKINNKIKFLQNII